ncbi:hypothetical protein [Adhaeribacter soli]|uniref:Uncharacterized protein n=1 Tax=Adhaeribacter soli TaxID=2607655 RepID=A0A5N1III9_9BACT|nr:hypothetical protein [Adhaeribacter soli]KAA9324956.1 hypothetical protein F0P94_18755 [Adhaeribacter soli]
MAEPESNHENPALPEQESQQKKQKKKQKKKDKKKEKQRRRNITGMYRAISRNHVSYVAIGGPIF